MQLFELETELVPLRVAATVAYFHITDSLRQVSSEEDLAEIVHLVAIALSTVAPIRRADGAVLTSAELHDIFYRPLDRKSTRLNSSHSQISYAVFCLKKKITYHLSDAEDCCDLNFGLSYHPEPFLLPSPA